MVKIRSVDGPRGSPPPLGPRRGLQDRAPRGHGAPGGGEHKERAATPRRKCQLVSVKEEEEEEDGEVLLKKDGDSEERCDGKKPGGCESAEKTGGKGEGGMISERGEGKLEGGGVVEPASTSWLSSDTLCLLFCCKREPQEERQEEQEVAEVAVYRVACGIHRGRHLVQALLIQAEDEDEEDVSESGRDDVSNTLKVLTAKLEDLRTCHDLIMKHGAALQKSLAELEALDNTQDLTAKIKTVNERATLFRISSNAMINACNDYVDVSGTAGRKWQRLLQHERDQRLRLEDMVEQLARQHSHLEQEAKEQMNQAMPPGLQGPVPSSAPVAEYRPPDPNPEQVKEVLSGHSHSEDEEENEFEDAVEELAENFIVHVNTSQAHRRSNSNVSQLSDEMASLNGSQATTPTDGVVAQANGRPKRQRRIRVPDKPNYPINLWSIMKNCIGKELSKIPMPVNFSEPLSFLQRLTEDFEYSDILDRAVQIEDSCEQLSLVAAFTVSSYATTAVRTAKPFNPLLGETYECDRTDDLGWRALNEQVSHHPPIVAQYVEGTSGWHSWQEFSMSSKFRGKYLQIIPLGIAHLKYLASGNHYTWRKVSTTVHNMIVGKLWLDNHGEMEIVNHKTGDKCCLKFIPYSYFSREIPKKVTGYVVDSEGTFKWFITGTWDEKIEACRVTSQSMRAGKPVYETGPPKVLWKRNPIVPESEKYYNFTKLACQLNEPEENVSPTDSRHRPDQRLMEQGMWDEANAEKLRLEEKQRATRRRREAEAEEAAAEGREYPPYCPTWFVKETDDVTGALIFRFTHEYWDCKERQEWSRCPDIF
ncbi:oxysterol-binding protein 1-like isoform X3 [Penaeus japonicus]|uniref:oxysterol-binding protein 1-like isoform X3 n=1 Tax=Penaeus japonicus TaxID=27405 RepID=UPI001C70D0A8|nr:oxysterol-binding protein 1-like isoform X3 [Penaeus japonicus]